MKKDVDDYLQEGIYGSKEINPSERKIYLGSLRERVVLALTKGEVMKNKGLEQLEKEMIENQGSKLLLNGKVSYRFFSKYKKLASKHNISFTTVKNNDAKTSYGAILTYDHAIDKKNILLDEGEKEDIKMEKKSFWKSIFTSTKK